MREDFYRAFEERFRGTREKIKLRLRAYLPFVQPLRGLYDVARAVDLGCGRGEWLELLQESGFETQGVDLDDGMLAACRELKLTVQTGDALTFLKSLPDASQGVVSGFHLAEHIPFVDLQVLVQEALRVLKPGGLLILETPNPENIVVGSSSFYRDPTHQRPIPPQLLSFLPEHYGFEKVKILRLQESEELSSGKILTLLDILNGVSPDYAIVARKTGSAEILAATDPAFEAAYGLTLESAANRYDQQVETRARQAETVYRWLENEWNNAKSRIETLGVQLGIAEGENTRIKSELLEKLRIVESENICLKRELFTLQRTESDMSDALEVERERANRLENERDIARVKVDELNQSNHHWWAMADDLSRKLQAVYASGCWRITKPVRWLHSGLVKIVQGIFLGGPLLRLTRTPCLVSENKAQPLSERSRAALSREKFEDLSLLTPRACQIYADLKSAIARRKKEKD